MIYLDSSVVLAELMSESRTPPPKLWQETLISSRLLEFEVWNRLHARPHSQSIATLARTLLERIPMIDFAPNVLGRALSPFPIPVRTLDALHLATVDYIRAGRQEVSLATYDRRLAAAAQALGVPLAAL